MAGILTKESHGELAKYPMIQCLAIRFFPQIGCLIVLSKVENNLIPPPGTALAGADQSQQRNNSAGSMHWFHASAVVPPDFQFQFESSSELHFKNPRMHELDKVNIYGSVYVQSILPVCFKYSPMCCA